MNDGKAATPYILDMSVLVAIARADTRIMIFAQELDAQGHPVVLPALAVTGALLDMRGEDAAELIEGTGMLGHAMIAPVADAEQAIELAAVIARTGLDPYDAHVAAVANVVECPIVTLDAAKWREHDLDEPLQVIEISDPEG